MKNFKLLILIAGSVLCSCSSPKALEYVTYHNFSVKNLGFNSSSITLDLEYYNPNNFGLQLKNTDLDIFINGNRFGHSASDTLIRIPRRDTFLLPVKFELDMQNLLKNAWSTLLGKEVVVKLSGKMKVGKGNVFMNFPLKYESKETFSLF